MKKVFVLCLTFLMIFTFSGCGSGSLVGSVSNYNETDDQQSPKITATDNQDDSAASVTYYEDDKRIFKYYDTAAEAWELVNSLTDKDCEITLLKDWVGDPETGFGEGSGYGDTGNLTPIDRDDDDISLTINLNGYTIDRNLDSKIKSGNVISLKKDGVYTIKNGILTGGNTTDRGGALWLDNNETTVNLENLVITGNYANGNGGAIFVKQSDVDLNITDTTITGNTSSNYGGAMYVQGVSSGFQHAPVISLGGVVVIKDNTGKNNRNNICLQWKDEFVVECNIHITDIRDLKEGSDIYIAPSNFGTSDLIVDYQSGDELMNFKDYFHSDDPNKIVCYHKNSNYNYDEALYLGYK